MAHRVRGTVWGLQFCPFEDVLGVGHGDGFTSMLVPGLTPFLLNYRWKIFKVQWVVWLDEAHSLGYYLMDLFPTTGAGEPNFDGLDANPYRSVKQRQEWEVKALLDKIQPELISLNPIELGQVDRATFQQRHQDRVQALVSVWSHNACILNMDVELLVFLSYICISRDMIHSRKRSLFPSIRRRVGVLLVAWKGARKKWQMRTRG